MSTDTHPIASFMNVSKEYRTETQVVHALRDVSLDIPAGTFVAVVGPSGCGKSTLLNLAGAMDFPTSGSVMLGQTSTSSLSDAALTQLRREKVGFIFQSFQLLQTLSVIENVELPMLLSGKSNARLRARECLSLVDLGELADRMPHQLSGGQMQRAAIARALAHEPPLLLADEPTGNLDSVTGGMILELLRRIVAERGATILLATHSVEAIAAVHMVVRMRDGRIEEIRRP